MQVMKSKDPEGYGSDWLKSPFLISMSWTKKREGLMSQQETEKPIFLSREANDPVPAGTSRRKPFLSLERASTIQS
jgi:hypothetical protein